MPTGVARTQFELDASPGVCQIQGAMRLLISLTDQSFQATKSVGIFNVSMGLTRGFMGCPEISELHILGNDECAQQFQDIPPHVHLHLLHHPVPKRMGRILWDQWGVSQAIRSIRPDWALLPKGFPPYFPHLGSTRLACYVHDVNWEYYRRLRDADSPFPWHELLYFRTLGLRALSIADLVLTSTRFNSERFAAYVPHVHTCVVGIGFDDAPQPPCPGEKWGILFYASPYPHKLTSLGLRRLRAWLAQRQDAERIRIHVVGSLPQGLSLPEGETFLRHPRLPYAKLQTLLREQCRVVTYFSEYEGFGMPPVESLRAGVPCVTSDLPPIRENIPARYLFSNSNEQDFIACMNRAWEHPDELVIPHYPDWRTVAQRCTDAMLNC